MSAIQKKILDWYPKAFAKKKFFRFNNYLIDLGLRGIGIMNHRNNGISGEKYLSEFLKSNYNLRTIFDVGAHKGDYADLFSSINGKIYCFEPNPGPYHVLKKRFAGNKKFVVHNMGLSDEVAEANIFDRVENVGSVYASLYEEVITTLHHSMPDKIKIQLTTVDEFSKSKSISKIDLLKIDTEGHEFNVLQGASRLIQDGVIDIIHFEFNEMNIISRNFLKDFIALLSNYNLYRLLPAEFLPIDYRYPHKMEIFAFQNVVAFRKDIDKLADRVLKSRS